MSQGGESGVYEDESSENETLMELVDLPFGLRGGRPRTPREWLGGALKPV